MNGFKRRNNKFGQLEFNGYSEAHIAFIVPKSDDKPERESFEAWFLSIGFEDSAQLRCSA